MDLKGIESHRNNPGGKVSKTDPTWEDLDAKIIEKVGEACKGRDDTRIISNIEFEVSERLIPASFPRSSGSCAGHVEYLVLGAFTDEKILCLGAVEVTFVSMTDHCVLRFNWQIPVPEHIVKGILDGNVNHIRLLRDLYEQRSS